MRSIAELAETLTSQIGATTDEFITGLFAEPETEQAKPVKPLAEWVVEICVDLRKARNVIVPAESVKFFVAELTADNYAYLQRNPAREWILRGNWQFKSPKILELQDFYPTEAQAKELRGRAIFFDDFIAFLREMRSALWKVLEAKNETAKRRANVDGIIDNLQSPNDKTREFSLELMKMHKDNLTKSEKIDELRKSKATMEQENLMLRRRLKEDENLRALDSVIQQNFELEAKLTDLEQKHGALLERFKKYETLED